MTEKEFQGYQNAKTEAMFASHWPRIEELLSLGHSPNDIASIMAGEGYWGRTSNRLGVQDLRWLQEYQAKQKAKEVLNS